MDRIGVSVLASGSNGNCTVVHCGDQALMIDCGISFRQLRLRMKQDGIPEKFLKGIVITHEHSDHISGLEKAAQAFGIPVYATALCGDVIHRKYPGLSITVLNAGCEFSLAGFTVCAFPVSHDAVDPVGYVLRRNDMKIGVATDFCKPNAVLTYQLKNCNTLVLESNYDCNMLAASPRPWMLKQRIASPVGHISNDVNAELLKTLVGGDTRNLILAHISHDCNHYELAEAAARNSLREIGRSDICLECGRRENPLPTIWTV